MRGGLIVLGLLFLGCGSSGSSSSSNGGTGGSSGGSGGSNSGGQGGSAGQTGGASSGGATSGGASVGGAGGASSGGAGGFELGPTDLACAETGGAGNCVACCADNHTAWESVAPVTRQCVCEGAQLCAAQCPSYCAGDADNTDCYLCIFPELTPDGACYATTRASCDSDSDCTEYVDCRANCIQVFGNTP